MYYLLEKIYRYKVIGGVYQPVEGIAVVATDESLCLGSSGSAVQIRLDGAKELVELRGPGR